MGISFDIMAAGDMFWGFAFIFFLLLAGHSGSCLPGRGAVL